MRIAITADHHGRELKALLIDQITELGHEIDDQFSDGEEIVDYPPLCVAVCREVTSGRAQRAIVIGGSGQGEQIACNKIDGIRAGLCHCLFTTEIARTHNDTNVLVMGAKVVTPALAGEIMTLWLTAEFQGGVHQQRLDQIAAIERGELI